MTKNILAVATVVALSACGGGSDDDDSGNDVSQTPAVVTTPANDNGGDTPVVTTPAATDAPTGGGAGPAAETSAGSYLGSFGGGEGVYVINNENELAGLAIFADGSAQSLFGSIGAGDTFSGELRQFIHNTSEVNPGVESFASVAGPAAPLSIDVNIVNGQTIESTAESATAVSLLAAVDGDALLPATAATLAGSYESVNSFAGQGEIFTLSTTMTFDGNSVTGSTTITQPDGTSDPAVAIVGGITEFGDAAIIEFTWGDVAGYSGVVFFNPNDTENRVVFVGENPTAADTDSPPTISAVMTLVP